MAGIWKDLADAGYYIVDYSLQSSETLTQWYLHLKSATGEEYQNTLPVESVEELWIDAYDHFGVTFPEDLLIDEELPGDWSLVHLKHVAVEDRRYLYGLYSHGQRMLSILAEDNDRYSVEISNQLSTRGRLEKEPYVGAITWSSHPDHHGTITEVLKSRPPTLPQKESGFRKWVDHLGIFIMIALMYVGSGVVLAFVYLEAHLYATGLIGLAVLFGIVEITVRLYSKNHGDQHVRAS